MHPRHAPNPKLVSKHRLRRGVVSLWTLLVLPVLIILFIFVVEGIHLWLARVELENGLEAAALAAVKDWAESGGSVAAGWTDEARTIGQDYAAANTINQEPIFIEKNGGNFSDPANPNENLTCNIDGVPPGNLIFGSITEEDPYVFEADIVPTCSGGGGRILADVTSQNMDSTDNSWGISFPTEEDPLLNANLLVSKIEINVDPNDTDELRFNFSPSSGLPPILSDDSPAPTIQGFAPDVGGVPVMSEQSDNYGFYDWYFLTSPSSPTLPAPAGQWPNVGPPPTTPQIVFSYDADITEILTIEFFEYDDGTNFDAGFSPGDRFRFGAGVERRSGGGPQNPQWATANGDHIGEVGVQITVYFTDINGNPVEPIDGVIGTFSDTEFSKNQCPNNDNPATLGIWEADDLGNYHLLVHPIRFLSPDDTPLIARDLPCPLTSAASNDKQSIVLAIGGGIPQGNFAVRAQARHQVPSLFCGFCGLSFGPFSVAACATAMYDCELQRPRLIRVTPDNFYCPTRPPVP